MKRIFAYLKERMEAGERSVLLLTVETGGSVPRAAGACMAVAQTGRTCADPGRGMEAAVDKASGIFAAACGTIGGGQLEYEAVQTAREMLSKASDARREERFLRRYDFSGSDAAKAGMICGGFAVILFLLLRPESEADQKFVEDGLRAEYEGAMRWMVIPAEEEAQPPQICALPAAGGKDGLTEIEGKSYYIRKLVPDGRVYLFGGGHLAQETVPLLAHLGFRCIVTDDREEFADRALFPDAQEVHLAAFSSLEPLFQVGPEDYILIMTRGHMGDADAERFALRTGACYIGVVGSRRKAAFIRKQLEEEGFSKEALDRVITPVGLEIGSETPEEIAVSIAAQLIGVRAAKRGGKDGSLRQPCERTTKRENP